MTNNLKIFKLKFKIFFKNLNFIRFKLNGEQFYILDIRPLKLRKNQCRFYLGQKHADF